VLERVKRLFDLQADPAVISAALGSLAKKQPGLRVPGSFDGFEMAVRAILDQQVSVAGARTLVGRLALQFGAPLRTPVPSLTRLFPTASGFANATVKDMRKAGITGARGATLLAMARAIGDGGLVLELGRRIEGRCMNSVRFPGSASGPRNTSPCAPSRGPTLFRTPTSESARRSEKTTLRRFCNSPKNGAPGAPTRRFIYGPTSHKNHELIFHPQVSGR
jgi:AraC family transcriptional regulator of adaptative response / DNA-3-methyladenine glycosylase II